LGRGKRPEKRKQKREVALTMGGLKGQRGGNDTISPIGPTVGFKKKSGDLGACGN